MDNQDLLGKVLSAFILAMSQATSRNYALLVLKDILEKNVSEYPFLRYINLASLLTEKISMNHEINSINSSEIAKFITILCNSLFVTEPVKERLRSQLGNEIVDELESRGAFI